MHEQRARLAAACFLGMTLLACGDDASLTADAGTLPDAAATPDAGKPDAGPPPLAHTAAVTTWYGDDGWLWLVDLDTEAVTQVASWTHPSGGYYTGGFRRVLVDGDALFLYGDAQVERFAWGAWDTPQLRWSVPQGHALVDAMMCGGRLWIAVGANAPPWSPSTATTLPGFDPATGALVAAVELNPFLPGTRPLLVTSMQVIGERVVVSLMRGGDGQVPPPDGAIVAIDCVDAAVVSKWDTPVGSRLYGGAGDPDTLWVVQPGPAAPRDALYQLRLDQQTMGGPFMVGALAEGTWISHVLATRTGRLAIAEYLYSGQGMWWSARGACVTPDEWTLAETEILTCTGLSSLALVGDDRVLALTGPCGHGHGTRLFRWRADATCSAQGEIVVSETHFPGAMSLR